VRAFRLCDLLEVRCGRVQEFREGTRVWASGIDTTPVDGAIVVGLDGITGDEQADRRHHGGPEKALFVYPSEHYSYWRRALDLGGIGPGGFGENLVVRGCTESDFCLGDVVRIGTVEAQVSQPRRPCWKPARRWGIRDLAIRIEQTGLTGWYLRIRSPGALAAGDPIELVSRPQPEWTVARASEVMRHRRTNTEAARRLANVEELAQSWRNDLRRAYER
jgi:MOSC domain-containing protein YiiM